MAITISPDKISDNGGTEITVTSTTDVFPDTDVLSAKITVGGVDYPCWHHDGGKGALFRGDTKRVVRIVVPMLPRQAETVSKPFTLTVRNTQTSTDIATGAGTVHVPMWQQTTLDFRRMLSHFEVGPHDVDLLPFPSATAQMRSPGVEVLEALTSAIGEMLNEAAGLTFTRTTASVAAGASVVPVETTFGFQSFGLILIGDRGHALTGKTDSSLSVVHFNDDDDYFSGDATGAAATYPVGTKVWNLSGNESDMAAARASVFVDFASGAFLDIIGRNLGVPRPSVLDGQDNDYRDLIRAVAYSARGTMFALERACDALLGNGNYELYEVLPSAPCKVFLKLSSSLLSTSPVGRTFATEQGRATATSSSVAHPDILAGSIVSSLKLAPESWRYTFFPGSAALLPSIFTERVVDGASLTPVWAFAGNLVEATVVTGTNSGLRIWDTTTGGTAFYRRYMRLRAESIGTFGSILGRTTTAWTNTSPKAMCMTVVDGTRIIAAGVKYISAGVYRLVLFNFNTDAEVGTASTTTVGIGSDLGGAAEVRIVKNGTGNVELWSGDTLVSSAAYTAFPTSSDYAQVTFGSQSTTAGAVQGLWREVWFEFETPTEFLNITFASQPPNAANNGFTSASLYVMPIGTGLRVTGPFISSYGQNGDFFISGKTGAADVIVSGRPRGGASVRADNVFVSVPGDLYAFGYPDSLSQRFVIDSGPNAGTYTIEEIVEPSTVNDLDTAESIGASLGAGIRQDVSTVVQVSDPLIANQDDVAFHLDPYIFENRDVTAIGWNVLVVSNGGFTLRFTTNMLATLPPGYVVAADIVWSSAQDGYVTLFPDRNSPVGARAPAYLPADLIGALRSLFADDLTVAGVTLVPVL